MPALKHLKTYLREAVKLRRAHPDALSWGELAVFFPIWRRSLERQASPLADERPWITFPAIEFLQRILTPEMRVFEFGAGGSTVFFAKRVKEIISVEHDPAWARQVAEVVARNGLQKTRTSLIEPTPDGASRNGDPADPAACVSSVEKYAGHSFRDYAASIEAHPDESFDLVLIDGRARPSCCRHSVAKLKVGGYLLLDNAERVHYRRIHESLDTAQWQKHDLSGPGPYNEYFWQT